MVMVHPKGIDKSIILDFFEILSFEKECQLDLSYYYLGQLMYTDIKYEFITVEGGEQGKFSKVKNNEIRFHSFLAKIQV